MANVCSGTCARLCAGGWATHLLPISVSNFNDTITIFRHLYRLMKIHILGICGTFMGSVAVLAKQLGFEVSGSDTNVYPPMSDLLDANGIKITSGYDVSDMMAHQPDLVIVGNAISRGNPSLEHVLDKKIPFDSGPGWIRKNCLKGKRVIAISGTHGKTTTTSMVSFILEECGLNPGFLVGGAPNNFGVSARWTDSDIFVIEADEYDTAFFDKRAKCVHYFPDIAIVNNIELDHVDIYDSIEGIIKQFHQMVRTMPQSGTVICSEKSEAMSQLIEMGVYSELVQVDSDWQISQNDQGFYEVMHQPSSFKQFLPGTIIGTHNARNALAALLACQKVGVPFESSIKALSKFKGVKRRLELIYDKDSIRIYDDFAHHPTAVKATLQAVKGDKAHQGRTLVVLEFGSRSMQLGVHKDALLNALEGADKVFCEKQPNLQWSVETAWKPLGEKLQLAEDKASLLKALLNDLHEGDQVLVLRNTGFGGFDKMLKDALNVV